MFIQIAFFLSSKITLIKFYTDLQLFKKEALAKVFSYEYYEILKNICKRRILHRIFWCFMFIQAWRPETLLKRDSNIDFFLWILRNF